LIFQVKQKNEKARIPQFSVKIVLIFFVLKMIKPDHPDCSVPIYITEQP